MLVAATIFTVTVDFGCTPIIMHLCSCLMEKNTFLQAILSGILLRFSCNFSQSMYSCTCT